MRNSRVAVVLSTAYAPAVWSTTYVVTAQFLPENRPLLGGVLRALPAGLLLLLIGRQLPRGTWWWRATVLGALNIGVFFALLFVAAYRLPGGVAGTLGAVQPLLAIGLAAGILGERLTTARLLAAVAGLGGVALLVLRADARLDRVGVAAALGSAAAMALGVVLTKKWGRPAPLLTVTAWQLVAGGLLLAPVAYYVEGPPPALTWSNLVGYGYLGLFGTALAYLLWFRGIGRLPVASVTLLGLLIPLIATVAGWALLDERLTWSQLLGGLVVLAAIVLVQIAPAPATGTSPARAGTSSARSGTSPARADGTPRRGIRSGTATGGSRTGRRTAVMPAAGHPAVREPASKQQSRRKRQLRRKRRARRKR